MLGARCWVLGDKPGTLSFRRSSCLVQAHRPRHPAPGILRSAQDEPSTHSPAMSESRTPAVSGRFYPSLPARLRADVRGFLGAHADARPAHAVITPHAGYRYAGVTAGAVFGRVQVPATCVVLGPNHAGRALSGEGGSILLSRSYRTPLGDVPLDEELANAIVGGAGGLLRDDQVAHEEEHSIEVVLPFLQLRNEGVRIVPIIIAWSDWDRTRRLADAIVRAVGARRDVLVVASSDMNHYEPVEVTIEKDGHALDAVSALDGEALLAVTERERISMCGAAAAACACEVAKQRGATGVEIVSYTHSGMMSGDTSRVVGYAGVILGAGEA